MKIMCKSNFYKTNNVPVIFHTYDDAINDEGYVTFSHGDSVEGGVLYRLKINSIYESYGIMICDNIMYYLVYYEELFAPDWIPSVLFDITDGTLPYFWTVKSNIKNNPQITAIICDEDINSNIENMIKLIYGNSYEVKRFIKKIPDYY